MLRYDDVVCLCSLIDSTITARYGGLEFFLAREHHHRLHHYHHHVHHHHLHHLFVCFHPHHHYHCHVRHNFLLHSHHQCLGHHLVHRDYHLLSDSFMIMIEVDAH